jgi:hypothetical protein
VVDTDGQTDDLISLIFFFFKENGLNWAGRVASMEKDKNCMNILARRRGMKIQVCKHWRIWEGNIKMFLKRYEGVYHGLSTLTSPSVKFTLVYQHSGCKLAKENNIYFMNIYQKYSKLTSKNIILGGVMVIVLAIGPEVGGFRPCRERWILRAIQVCSKTSCRWEAKPSIP